MAPPITSPKTAGGGRAAWIVAFCCLASMGEGFDLQAPGVTMPVLAPLFHLATGEGGGFIGGFFSQKSLFLSMSTFGLMLGAMIGGRASDLIGRKWVTVISVALFAGLSAVTARSTSADMLLWARFFTGLGLGGALPNLIAIATESVSPGRRNTAVGFLYASMPTGGALVSLSSYAFANPEHWRTIYYLGGLVPLLAIPGLILGVPRLKAAAHERVPKPSVGLALFGEGRAGRTLILWLCFLFALITQYILLSWLPTLLISKGLPRPDASIVQIGFNVFGAMGSVATGILIDRPGRPTTTALVFLAGIAALAILAVAPASLGVSVIVGSLVGCAISGTQTIVYALAPGAYPTRVRGTGVGFAVAAGRIGAATGPLLAGAIIGSGAGPAKVLGLMVPLMVLAGLCAWHISRTTRRTDTFATDADAAALAAG
jgi:AAHS family 3-hydroxyphenylpropionic acid transporter